MKDAATSTAPDLAIAAGTFLEPEDFEGKDERRHRLGCALAGAAGDANALDAIIATFRIEVDASLARWLAHIGEPPERYRDDTARTQAVLERVAEAFSIGNAIWFLNPVDTILGTDFDTWPHDALEALRTKVDAVLTRRAASTEETAGDGQ